MNDAAIGAFRVIGSHEAAFADGDPLEVLVRMVAFEAFRPVLEAALGYSDGARGGRPSYDPVVMLKLLVLAAQHNVSDVEYLIRDRLN